MLKKSLNLLTFILLVMVPIPISAQELPVEKWWRIPHIVEQLGLKEDQLTQLDTLFVESTRKLAELKNAVEKEQFELMVLLEKEALDEDGIMKQVQNLEKERALLNEERVRIIIKTRRIIGYQAFIELKEIVEKRSREKVKRHINDHDLKKNNGTSDLPHADREES